MLGIRAPKPISVKGVFFQIKKNKIQQLCSDGGRHNKGWFTSGFKCMHAPLNFLVFDAVVSKHTATHCLSSSQSFILLFLIASAWFFPVFLER